MDHIKSVQKLAGSLEELSGCMRIRNQRDQRYTCNAREAVAYLRYTSNFRVADRVAIMTNLCNYDLCLDTYFLEAGGYGLGGAVFCQVL